MYLFLIPLLLGFSFNSASAFTAFFSHRFGERNAKVVSVILRDVLGIPVWAIGYALAVTADSRMLFNPVPISSTLGWLLILSGAAIIFVGLLALRWRAAAPSVRDTLVVQGIYAHIRHPLYSGMILELVGLFLWLPTLTVFIACGFGLVWAMAQARLEEMDLVDRLPGYRDYMRRVPRFIPRFTSH